MSETDKIIQDAQLGAATETAIEEMQQLMGVDRTKAIAILMTVAMNKEKVVGDILDAAVKGGMAAVTECIRRELYIQLSIQNNLRKLSE